MSAADLSQREHFERQIESFENAWRCGARPAIADFLPPESEAHELSPRRELLYELIAVDLEYRWRAGKQRGRKPGSRGPLLLWYVKRFGALESLDALPLSLVAEEYRVRKRWGDQPSHAEYLARFPRRGLALVEALAGVDVALADEWLDVGEPQALKQARKATQVDPDAPLPITDYHLKRQIGEGGMCRVYTAVQISLDKPVAVKVLRKERLKDVRSVTRFVREARLTASLRHPGIVQVHGLGRLPDGGYFMVLDLIVGQDLSLLGAVPQVQAVQIMAKLAAILADVHGAGLIHGDLKPSNVLTDSLGNIFLLDFGMARHFGDRHLETVFDEHPAGTAAFMAPEQIDARLGRIGPWTDIYGLGGILHWLLAGRPRFDGLAVAEILALATARSPPPVALPEFDSPDDGLGHICRRCLSQSPQERIQSAAQFLAEIRPFVAERQTALP